MKHFLNKFLTTTLLVFFVVGLLAPFHAAARSSTSYFEQLQWPFYDSSGSSASSCGSSLIGGNNQAQIFNFFISKGLNPAQAAGAYGNIMHESGGDPQNIQNPGGRSQDPADAGSGGWGLIQWTPGSKIIGLAKEAGVNGPIYELATQLELIWQHMNNHPVVTKPFDLTYYKTLTDYKVTTAYFEDKIEGAGIKAIESRQAFAQDALTKYDSGASTGSGLVVCGGGLGTSPDGFVFPLKTTKATIIAGVDGAVWCYNSQNNCHHDYNAADIHAETGTPVVAVRSGKITNIRSGPARLVLLADNGRAYYYTHMQAGSLKVSEGQPIKAGDQVGAVGTNADAEGSVRHLHIDELPNPPYTYRPGCSNAECQAYPFINIQPELLAAFNNLP